MRGLVLEGGGAKGSYQIGACKALREIGLEFTAVAGTSIGAINGAIIAQGDLDKAYELWYNISLAKVFDVREEYLAALREAKLDQEGLGYLLGRARDILNNRGLDTALMKGILQDNIEETKLRQSGMLFGMVTVSLTDRKPLEVFLEDIPLGQVVNYLMASASLPIFKLERIADKEYLDGGFYDNLPIRILYDRGYRDIVAIRTHSLGRIRKMKASDLRITVIEPRDDLGSILDFSQEGARRNLLLGYFDTLRAYQGLRGLDYYLKPGPTKEDYAQFLLGLGEEAVKNGARCLGLKEGNFQQVLFESLVPKILELGHLQTENVYEGATLLLCEVMAKKYRVDRYKIYSWEQLLTQLATAYQKADGGRIPQDKGLNLSRYTPFLSQQRREELLARTAEALLAQTLSTRVLRTI